MLLNSSSMQFINNLVLKGKGSNQHGGGCCPGFGYLVLSKFMSLSLISGIVPDFAFCQLSVPEK